MAYRVELTSRGGRDLRRLFRRIHAEDSRTARDWFNGLEAAIKRLGESPSRCPVTPEDPTLRHLLYGRGRNIYRIIFAIEESRETVVVIHIRHGAREPIPRKNK
jgi:plasmid stabilization system protein ParE